MPWPGKPPTTFAAPGFATPEILNFAQARPPPLAEHTTNLERTRRYLGHDHRGAIGRDMGDRSKVIARMKAMERDVRNARPRTPELATVRCSFCRRNGNEVAHIFAGPDGVFICDECAMMFADQAKRDAGR